MIWRFRGRCSFLANSLSCPISSIARLIVVLVINDVYPHAYSVFDLHNSMHD
jgi:hypothetical protein